jgi:tryptophanyl-tRNA synthetase
MDKEVILTGIRANNDLHIGNYFGALLPMVDMAKNQSESYRVNLMLADLHAFTTPIDHSKLHDQIEQTLKLFVAAGLPMNNGSIHLYRQSFIPAHSELAWILDCFTGFGELSRMTEFKDKSAKFGAERIGVGQFNYPPLMAADILLYGAKWVPVGDDQRQHIEYTRDIAERMNNKFGDLFMLPEPVAKQHEFFGKDQGLRIKDLADPTKKMSKSEESGKGIIYLGDEPDEAAKKVMSATTDSLASIHFDLEKQPGITNLLQILALLSGRPQAEVNQEWEGKSSYGELKTAVADEVKVFLNEFQAKLQQVDHNELTQKLEADEETMRKVSDETLLKVQNAVGLRP